MTLYALSIRRPVLATVLSLAILLFGILGLRSLGVRELPSTDSPLISISTDLQGAAADVVETQITEPLEDAVNGIDGIRTLTSVSREGRSTVRVEFELGADLDRAANDVRDRVFGALDRLPPDVDPPEIAKADAEVFPIVMVSVSSDRRSLLELSRLADDLVKERLQTITGVASVDIWGDKSPAMRIWIDPRALAGYELTLLDVRDALARENVELPAGRVEGTDVELPVRAQGRLRTPEEFAGLILRSDVQGTVRLDDVATVELAPRNLRTILRREGVPMVAVVLRPQPGANYVAIADEYYRRLELIREDLPEDVTMEPGFDSTIFIRRSIREVAQTIGLAFVLVVLVIFFFLRDVRTTVVPVVVIPVSLVGTFAVLAAAGFSINVLTLLGMVLAIGLVVDDAIVVLENIYAKIEAGMEPVEAGIEGTREIFFAVISTTLALVAVLLPLLFLGGLTGRLFREFATTLVGAVSISSFVALTLTPMLATRLLGGRGGRRPGHSRFWRWTEPFFQRLSGAYARLLRPALARPLALSIPVLLVASAVAVGVYESLPRELAPLEDRSLLRLDARGREGATFEYMDRFAQEMTVLVQEKVPEARMVLTVTSPGFAATTTTNSAFLRLFLTQPEERERSQMEIADVLKRAVPALGGARVAISQQPTISVGRRRGLPVQVVLQAPELEDLRRILPRILEAARDHPMLSTVDVDLSFDKPQIEVEIDRPRARDLGVTVIDVARTLQLAFAEQRLGYFTMDGRQFEVVAQVRRQDRDETFDLASLRVPSRRGEPVLLDQVVRAREVASPPQLYRYDRWASATVSADMAPGIALGSAIEALEGVVAAEAGERILTKLTGQARDFAESARDLHEVFVLALVLVYLVLAAQFESFRDPVVLLLTVPMALAGALAALGATGQSLNLFSQIGMVMLVGLVTKNAILIVEFANQRLGAGLSPAEAIRESARARFRPVLMTSLSTGLGAVPLALALGAGSESRIPMGVAILGGLAVGTLLTLLVVPAAWLVSRPRTSPDGGT